MAFSIQRANTWKRISAYLFDTIIALIVAVGIAVVLSAALGYNEQNAKLKTYRDEYIAKYEQLYPDVDFDISQENYEKLSDAEQDRYQEAVKACREETNKDARVIKTSKLVFSLMFVIVSLSALVGVAAVHFVAPLFFKNGQTLGKKIFGVAVMRSNGVKISNPVLFIRAIFGVYTIETAFPLFVFIMLSSVGALPIILLFGLQFCLLFFTRNHTCIHDLLSDTVVVDMGSQRIFDTQEEAAAFFKAQKEEEEAQKKDYI